MFPKDYQTNFEKALERAKRENKLQEFLDSPSHYYPEELDDDFFE